MGQITFVRVVRPWSGLWEGRQFLGDRGIMCQADCPVCRAGVRKEFVLMD